MTSLDATLDQLDANRDAALERLFEFLRFESISTDPAYKGECAKAADWIAGQLSGIGFDASVRPTTGHPMVVAHADGPVDAPHVLFYAHYDVQPVDPLDLWERPPFEPFIQDAPEGGQIRARGAADDKGQMMTFVEACRAWRETSGGLPIRVSILFEGEEESGSPSLKPFLEANKDELSLDMALVCDTGMWNRRTPAITTKLRGIMEEEITITGPKMDLHSGMFGGAAANPIRLLTRILSDLHDDQGRVTLPGFYDGVTEPPEEVAAQWAALDFDPAAFLGQLGLSVPSGEDGRTVLEKVWSRPTCEFNGITGGYTGEGFKTVIPSQASAKVSCRLVWNQDPEAIRAAMRKHVTDRLPSDCTVDFINHGGSPATVMPTDAPVFAKARQALSDEWGTEAAFIGCGGSIPIVQSFRTMLGMDSMLIGFGLEDDRVHSPNEKYDLASFQKGARAWARILHAMAG